MDNQARVLKEWIQIVPIQRRIGQKPLKGVRGEQ